jgi:hypothetical protein
MQTILTAKFRWRRQISDPRHVWLDHISKLSDFILDIFDRLIQRAFYALHNLLGLFREVKFRANHTVKFLEFILQTIMLLVKAS